MEEGGIGPLLKLVKEGRPDGQESAARAIGLLGRDQDSVDQMLLAGVCTVFAKVLKEGTMKVEAMVAWAISELANGNPKCQDLFFQTNVIRLLVSHLAFETVQEHIKYTIPLKGKMSIHSVVLANNSSGNNGAIDDHQHQQIKHPMHSIVQSTMVKSLTKSSPSSSNHVVSKQPQLSLAVASLKGREFEDPETKATMKAMAARAMWQLAKGNPVICKSITESKALLCFAVLLEKGPEEVQYNSAMALMEITRVAEKNDELRRSAFKPNSPACRAVVDQILRVVEKGESSDLLLPCIIAIGCLSRTFRATETRVIAPLVRLLDEKEEHISKEAAIALTKFACSENYLHKEHCKAILAVGGAGHLVQLVYLGAECDLQINALVLLCYIALHVPHDEALSQAEALTVLEWASKQSFMVQEQAVEKLLSEAKGRLEVYQSRGSRGFP